MKKVALFVDWDNLRWIIRKIKYQNSDIETFDFNNSSHISTLFQSFIDKDEEIYRIFFYTAKPLQDEEIKNQLGRNSQKQSFQNYADQRPNLVFNNATEFLNNIVKEDYIALRTGKMQVRGVNSNGKPDLIQKQVDMLIGLDISEVSFRRYADKILVFSKDTDMIPALKTSRINGLTVILANFKEHDYLSNDLIVHSDLIRKRSLLEINNNL